MAITIDWLTKIINVPKADLALIQASPTEIRELNINEFRSELKAIEASYYGMPNLKTHDHNTEVSLGGIVYARVVEILAPYTITFEDGQYAVNLVGANSNIGDRINVNQVSVRSANSAGLISNAAIEFSSFNGGVFIDEGNITGNAKIGTLFPAGTLQQPCIDHDDIQIILQRRGFSKVFVLGNLILNDFGDEFINVEFQGDSAIKTNISIIEDINMYNCEFYDCTLTGYLDGNSHVERSVVNNLHYIQGFIYNCAIGPDTIWIAPNGTANIFNCYSSVPGTSTPTIDLGGNGTLALRDYHGGALIKNYNGNGSHSIDLSSGQIKLDSTTVTSGTFVVRGVGKLIDENGTTIKSGTWNSGVTIINELVHKENFADAVWDKVLP